MKNITLLDKVRREVTSQNTQEDGGTDTSRVDVLVNLYDHESLTSSQAPRTPRTVAIPLKNTNQIQNTR